MKNDYRFAEEVEQALPEIFEQFHQQVTPNFSKDDWLELYEKVANGDGIAVDMFHSLFAKYVMPNLHPDFLKFLEEEDFDMEDWK